MLGISRHDHVTNESVYSQTQARPLSSEVKGRQLRFLSHSLRRDKEDHINRFVCTICRETKCWRAETFVFAIHLKSHYGRLQSTDGERNTTPYRRQGLLETSGCRLPEQFGLNCRRDETRRDETDRLGRHLRLTWPATTEVSRSLGGLSWDWSAYHCEGSIGPSVRFEEFSLSRFKHYICHHYTEIFRKPQFFLTVIAIPRY